MTSPKGDIVLLEAGDRVPADLDLLEAHYLALDESMLTGESVLVHPERGRRAHAGTFVVEGEAEAEVTATGTGTRLAGIAALTRQAHRRPSPLALQLHRAVKVIAAIAVTVGLVFFGIAVAFGMAPGNGLPSWSRSSPGRSPAGSSRWRSACCRSSLSTSGRTCCPPWPWAPSRPTRGP